MHAPKVLRVSLTRRASTVHVQVLLLQSWGCIVNGPSEMADADLWLCGWCFNRCCAACPHLCLASAGVAIAVMGCIVNGPGEMADADFGYVGGAPGKIDLYVGKEVVQRGIPMDSVRNCAGAAA